MKANTDLSARIWNIKLKWMRKLKQEDNLYFDSRITLKHLSLFNLNSIRKGRAYTSDLELESDIAIYLMMIMIMNSVTDHEPSLKELERFAYVPWYTYKLSQGINPYKSELDAFDEAKKIGVKRFIAEIYDKAWETQEKKLKVNVPRDDYDMLGDIIDYYSHETVAYALIEKKSPKEFDYQLELSRTFKYVLEKHYKGFMGKTVEEIKYRRIMSEFVVQDLKMRKYAA